MRDIKVVIGVDFGTSRSGYAYAFTSKREVIPHLYWDGQPIGSPKTLTQLLYSPYGEVESWGWKAPETLAEKRKEEVKKLLEECDLFQLIEILREKRKQSISQRTAKELPKGGYILFQEFKMKLHESEGLLEDKSFVVDLIADYLRCIKDLALEEVKELVKDYIKENEILWCLTVPTIWTDKSKQLMRVAAQEAGMIGVSDEESERLVFALEPEAAVLACINEEPYPFNPRERLMVVDCGGGTVDITVHEIVNEKNLRLKEIVPSVGGPFGARDIDKRFRQFFLSEKLTSNALEDFHDIDPIGYLEINMDWERTKCEFKANNKQKIFFPIRRKLDSFLKQVYPEVLEEIKASQNGDDDCIYLAPGTMENLFKPTLDGIIDCIKKQFDRLDGKGCDYIYLIGGFSKSELLQEWIERYFGSKAKIIKPYAPDSLVVKGAVFFGLDHRSVFISRCVRRTYGFVCWAPFETGIDPEDKRVHSEIKKSSYCRDRFYILVKSGQSVSLGESRIEYLQNDDTKDKVNISIYSTESQNVRYIDESGVNKEINLEFECKTIRKFKGNRWRIIFYFGQTEIKVTVEDLATNEVKKVSLDFI
jgi:molecular chaperone DnaK (HSP70)